MIQAILQNWGIKLNAINDANTKMVDTVNLATSTKCYSNVKNSNGELKETSSSRLIGTLKIYEETIIQREEEVYAFSIKTSWRESHRRKII